MAVTLSAAIEIGSVIVLRISSFSIRSNFWARLVRRRSVKLNRKRGMVPSFSWCRTVRGERSSTQGVGVDTNARAAKAVGARIERSGQR